MALQFPNFLKIACLSRPPEDGFLIMNSDKSITHTMEAVFIQLLSDAIGFSFKLVHPKDGQLGRKIEDGNWTGVIGIVQREEADIAVNMLGLSEERSEAVDFSYPYHVTDVTFITYNPEPMSKSLAMFYPFSTVVWIMTVFSFIFISIFFYLLHQGKKQLVRTTMSVYASIFGQTFYDIVNSLSEKVLFLTWIYGIMLINLCYQALLLSFLSFPPLEGVRTIPELARAIKQGSHVAKTFRGSYLITVLMESEDINYKIIGKSLNEYSVVNMGPAEAMIRKKKKIAFVTARPIIRYLESKYFLSEDSFQLMMFGIAIRKKFCCKDVIDKAARRILEAGLYEKFLKDMDTKAILKEGLIEPEVEEKHILTLDDTIGALVIFISGNTLAIIIFMVEILSNKLHFKRCELFSG